MFRVGIVGASSLAGKELSEELDDSSLGASEFVLLDEEDAAGQITSAANEVSFIQRLEKSSFQRLDFAFFSGPPEVTRKYWQNARRASASIIDMSYALEMERDVLVRGPWVTELLDMTSEKKTHGPNLNTPAIVPAHPAALMLALAAGKLRTKFNLSRVAATVMEPASQYGREAMDELHQQTVNLLSFQSLPRDQYDAQVSFNLLPSLGEAAKVKLAETEARIRRHYDMLADGVLPHLALQLIQAPVFHGYAASAFVELETPATLGQVEEAMAGDHVDIVSTESDPPSNLSAAGQREMMVQVRKEPDTEQAGSGFWLWLVIDNLKFAAMNAIACATELRQLRPQGKVQ